MSAPNNSQCLPSKHPSHSSYLVLCTHNISFNPDHNPNVDKQNPLKRGGKSDPRSLKSAKIGVNRKVNTGVLHHTKMFLKSMCKEELSFSSGGYTLQILSFPSI